jgi:prepilin-type N-terminal cleavage/methylation domain-containing protein/prepilin-type processing-associated H-X9-DG protein
MRRRTRPAFTLIELLVVIAIIGVLVSLLLPAVQKVREAAARVQCQNNLKQLGLAVHHFENTDGYYPQAWYVPGDPVGATAWGGWCTQLLPFLEQDNLFKSYRQDRSWWAVENQPAVNTQIKTYTCPSSPVRHVRTGLTVLNNEGPFPDRSMAIGDYIILRGYSDTTTVPAPVESRVPGMLMGITDTGGSSRAAESKPTLAQVTDGTSNTAMIGERAGRPEFWVKGRKVADTNTMYVFDGGWASYQSVWLSTFLADGQTVVESGIGPCVINCNNGWDVYAFHPGGANVVFGDGSVRFLRESLSGQVFRALLSRQRGEVINANDF